MNINRQKWINIACYIDSSKLILCCLSILLGLGATVLLRQNTANAQTSTGGQYFSGIRVEGNKLINLQNQVVLLHGVDKSGTEYECVQSENVFDGPNDLGSVQAMKSWGINAVRLPLNEDCWLGINGAMVPSSVYQQSIENYVTLLNQNGMYVILDLHWNAPGTAVAESQQVMADADHSPDFWKSIAMEFGKNNEVLFDVYNEPHSITWSCWQNGTGCTTNYQVASMQDLVNVIRQSGAENVIMLGGLDYANDLTGWIAHMPTDPLHDLVASFHMYGGKFCDSVICWGQEIVPVMQQVPVIAGEFGESINGTDCSIGLDDTFMNWMDQHDGSYLAWQWNVWGSDCGNLSLITDYTGTPHMPNGIDYRNHLNDLLKHPIVSSSTVEIDGKPVGGGNGFSFLTPTITQGQKHTASNMQSTQYGLFMRLNMDLAAFIGSVFRIFSQGLT